MKEPRHFPDPVSDADGDPLSWEFVLSPTGMSVNRNTGTIRWTPTADQIAESSDADDRGRDAEQVGEHDPLDLLERRVEGLCQGRQTHIGNAGAQRVYLPAVHCLG